MANVDASPNSILFVAAIRVITRSCIPNTLLSRNIDDEDIVSGRIVSDNESSYGDCNRVWKHEVSQTCVLLFSNKFSIKCNR